MTYPDRLPNTVRDCSQLCLAAIKDEGMPNLMVIDEKIRQIQRPVCHRAIDEHQIERLAAVFRQPQKLFEALNRGHSKITELVEQPFDSHAVKVLHVGDQDS
ncbi:hypothetical protein ASE98_15850 [Pseudomonas sp. Leaf48]|nr:hypothetical protein ASE98_15850 [Pseudomonas sp. Leaf48]